MELCASIQVQIRLTPPKSSRTKSPKTILVGLNNDNIQMPIKNEIQVYCDQQTESDHEICLILVLTIDNELS